MNALTCCLLVATVGAPARTASQPDPRCGSYCLYIALKAVDVPISSHADLAETLGRPLEIGYSMGELAEAAKRHGAHVLPVRTNLENLRLRTGRFACIAHLDGHHFVLLNDLSAGGEIGVIDPPRSYRLAEEALASRWTGTALLVSPEPLIPEEDLRRPLPWAAIGWGVAGSICLVGLILTGRRSRRAG